MPTLELVLVLAGLAAAPVSPAPAPPERWRSLELEGGGALEYAVVTPENFDPEAAWPVLVALPPGAQTREMVDMGIQLYWEKEAKARGWVVVSPAAPEGRFFDASSDAELDALLDTVESEFRVAGGKLHLAGVSNGGRSAFHVVGRQASRFASLSVLPGLPGSEEDWERLADVAALPISLWAGGEDHDWSDAERRTAERLGELGATDVHLGIREGEGHVIDSSVATEVFDRLDLAQARSVDREHERLAVEAVLDALHRTASEADEEGYFSLFAPGAVFIGTDATERWTLAAFHEYAKEFFQGDSAWTYVPVERHVGLSADGATAWFDERLTNAKYGETRSSGVLVRLGDDWRIAHYVLSFAIPNDRASDVVEIVRGGAR